MTSVTTTKTSSTRKRQGLTPNSVLVQRTPVNTRMSVGGSTLVSRRSNVLSHSSGPLIHGKGEAERVSRETVETVKGMRGKEKRDLNDLNGRLAGLLEQTHTLKTTNEILFKQVEELRKLKGITGDRVRDEYEQELKEAKEALSEASQRLAPLEAEKIGLEDKVEFLEEEVKVLNQERDKAFRDLEKVNQLCGDFEGENAALKRNIEAANNERDAAKRECDRIREDNMRLRNDIDAGRTKQIEAERERDELAAELEFQLEAYEAEFAELKELLEKYQQMQPKFENMFKSGVKDMMSEMSQHYENQLEETRRELERRYEDRLHDLEKNQRRDNTDSNVTKTENKQLKTDIKDLKDRLKDLEPEILSLQATTRRDDTDGGIVKQENKSLKSQISDSRRNLDDLNEQIERLRRDNERLKRERDLENDEHEHERADLLERIAALEAELGNVNMNLQEIQNSKLDLELEIACYKKLLDGEESKMRSTLEDQANMQSRGAAQLANMIGSGGSSGGSGGGQSVQQSSNPAKTPVKPSETGNQPPNQPPKNKKSGMSQSVGRIQIKRSSKCGVAIAEVAQSGRHIILHNENPKHFDLSNWTISRSSPRDKNAKFTFGNFSLPPNKKVMVLSHLYHEDLEHEEETNECAVFASKSNVDCRIWGTGNGDVFLTDPKGNRKASSSITFIADQ